MDVFLTALMLLGFAFTLFWFVIYASFVGENFRHARAHRTDRPDPIAEDALSAFATGFPAGLAILTLGLVALYLAGRI